MSDSHAAGLVAVALHEPEWGGATQALARVLPLLERRGWSFAFWVPGDGPAKEQLEARGYPVTTAERQLRFSVASMRQPPGPLRRLGSVPAYLRSWRSWMATQDARLLHCNSILSLPELLSRPRNGPPVVLHTHEVLPAGPRGRAAALLARRATVVVTVSEAAAEALRRVGLKPHIVHPGAPVPTVAPPAPTDGSPLVVGTLGTVCRRKGSDLFVAAAERVRRQRDDVEFRMAGSLVVGGERPWAEALVAAAVGSDIVHKPWVDTFTELAGWDIFVLPARSDPFPLAVLEAMSMGKPIVATRVGGIPEQLGREAGLLVELENADGIAAAVLQLADSPDLRASLGAAARDRVESLFTLERQAEALDRVYRTALTFEAGGAGGSVLD